MAKSQRSKVKKRLRSCRAEHLYKIEGKARMERISARLNDPNYNMKNEYTMGPNAFLEPNNPMATFPKKQQATILDFRTKKMENGGYTAVNVFRKHLSENSKKSKYATEVRTQEDLESGAATSFFAPEPKKAPLVESSDDEMDVDQLTKMTSKMKISKKPKATKAVKGEDVDMEAPRVQIVKKSKQIRKKIDRASQWKKRGQFATR